MKLNKLQSNQKLTNIQSSSLPMQDEDYIKHLIHTIDLCYELSVFMSVNEPSETINNLVAQRLAVIEKSLEYWQN